ncbi:hypothetical protein [Lederbergia citri]|uniref:Uncharacterized protein n=1 Tax=Lederbergia citri TaxID=2833580 RepID=A0A942TKH1_9BACI|nr:hypothetical protein [Lederbergia citri]MBS4197692.1 hypothetical protein [Lederbergia citri]
MKNGGDFMFFVFLITIILGFVAVVNRLNLLYEQNKIIIDILENALNELPKEDDINQ